MTTIQPAAALPLSTTSQSGPTTAPPAPPTLPPGVESTPGTETTPGHGYRVPPGFGDGDEGRVQAWLAQQGIEKPNTAGTILKNVAIFGGIGAALGLGASFLPVLGPCVAVIGGAVGACIGLVKGAVEASDKREQYNLAAAWAGHQMNGGSPYRQLGPNTYQLGPGWTLADLDRITGEDDIAPARNGSTSTTSDGDDEPTTSTSAPSGDTTTTPPSAGSSSSSTAPPVLTGLDEEAAAAAAADD